MVAMGFEFFSPELVGTGVAKRRERNEYQRDVLSERSTTIEFDEKFWHAVVDRVTVYNDDRLVYSLKDGTEITIEL